MKAKELASGIRERLRELRAQRDAIEQEEKALHAALYALDHKPAPVKPRVKRRPTAERFEDALAFVNAHPGEEFSSVDLRDRAKIPGGTSTRIARMLAESGKVDVVGKSASGVPIVRAKAGGPEPAPDPTDALPEPEEEKIPEPGLPDEGKRQRVRRRPIRSMRDTRMRIVDYLSQHGPTPQNEVAEALDLASSSMTAALRGMDGSVAREKFANGDRPGWHYSLRLKGRGEGERETVTTPGEGVEEGRLR